MGLLDIFKSNGGEQTEETCGSSPPDNPMKQQPCNVSGHDWPEWEEDSFGPRTESAGLRSNKLRVYTGMDRNCKKCDQYDTKEKTIGYIKVDTKNEEIGVV